MRLPVHFEKKTVDSGTTLEGATSTESVSERTNPVPSLFLPLLVGWCAIWPVLAGIGFLYGLRCPDGEESRRWWTGFWTMTLFWIAVDLGIVVWALVDPVTETEEFRRLLAINGGLDLLYLATGVILATRRDQLARGFGAAILVQGGFLLIFDLAWWWMLGTPAG